MVGAILHLGRDGILAETEEEGDNQDEEKDTRAQQSKAQLDWKDYVALAIAALETVLLPMVILVLILFTLVFIIK